MDLESQKKKAKQRCPNHYREGGGLGQEMMTSDMSSPRILIPWGMERCVWYFDLVLINLPQLPEEWALKI